MVRLWIHSQNTKAALRLPRCSTHQILPLGKIVEPSFLYDKLSSLFHQAPPHDDLVEMISWLEEDTFANLLRQHLYPMSSDVSSQQRKVSRQQAIYSDLKHLVSQKTFTHPNHYSTLFNAVFTVPKSDGHSSRLIFDGRLVNSLIEKSGIRVPPTPLPPLSELIHRHLPFKIRATLDAMSMFYQFRVESKSLQALLGFKLGGTRGNFCPLLFGVLPMGLSFAPAFAQHVSMYMLDRVRQKIEGHGVTYVLDVWIDNFIISASTDELCQALVREVQQIAMYLGLRLKPCVTSGSGGIGIDILGLRFENLSVSLSDRNCRSLSERMTRVFHNPTPWNFVSWFGSVLFATQYVCETPLCAFTLVMSRLRKVMTGLTCHFFPGLYSLVAPSMIPLTWHSRISLSVGELECMRQMTEAAMTAVLVPSLSSSEESTMVVWTDASSWGLGGVNVQDDKEPYLPETEEIWTLRSNLTDSVGIFAAELAAGVLALLRAKEDSGKPASVWYTDNAAASRAVIRGHSSSPLGDFLLCALKKNDAWPRSVCLVPSACQRADPLSRGEVAPLARCPHRHIAQKCRFPSS